MSEDKTKKKKIALALILNALKDILEELKRQETRRELSLAKSRLEESIMWLEEAINGG